MIDLKGIKITYIGDHVFYVGPTFIESPFEMMAKNCQLKFLGTPITESLSGAGASVKAYSNWELYHFSPQEYNQVLEDSDILILSDVEARCFHLSPDFFEHTKYGKEIVTYPDRLKATATAVENGMGLMFMGGWLSFSGHMEKGGWRRCSISDWLPFECLTGEDLVENSEGYGVEWVNSCHPIVKGLDTETIPPLLGYNEFVSRNDMEIIWKIKETGHPLLGVSQKKKGRMITYASDPVPHWGINLMLWPHYANLWQRMAAWAAGKI